MDWVAVLEAAYRLEPSETAWLEGLLSRLDDLDRGLGVVAQVFRLGPEGSELVGVASHGGDPGLAEHVARMTLHTPPRVISRLWSTTRVTSMRLAMREIGVEDPFAARLRALPTPHADVHFLAIEDGDGHLLALSGGRRTFDEPMPHAGRLRRVAAHVGAGLRMRRRLAGEACDGDAVFSADGKLEDATERGIGAREILADAVRRSERARGRARERPDEALELWQGLVAGQWSLVDRVESDGKRYVVAHQNAPHVADPRGLTQREAQIAESLGRGSTLKEIAYDHGLGLSAITKAATRARTKLGLRSLGELAALFSPRTRFEARELEIAGERFVATPIARSTARLEGLSSAERDIAERVARGESNAEIAAARGTSPRTVTNQLRRLFDKLGVGSRTELARRLAEG